MNKSKGLVIAWDKAALVLGGVSLCLPYDMNIAILG